MQPKGTIFFDIETHDADLMYDMSPEEFFRLGGFKWKGDNGVTLTTNLQELRDVLLSAKWIVGHNIHAFDLRAVFGHRSDVPLYLAEQGRVLDTWTHGPLVFFAPPVYVNRHGKKSLASSPDQIKRFYGLDELAFQLGVPGKTNDLQALAREFGGFGSIPVDDERFRDYLVGDVLATEAVARELLKRGPLDAYAMREQRIAARAAVISSNGWVVDRPRAQARVDELAARREVIMAGLVRDYEFPTEGKSPWASAKGKEAIFAALADLGITPKKRPDWPRTATGNPSLGGDALKGLTAGTAAEELGTALAELKGQRSLAQLALDSCRADGKAHPFITMLQRSGRWSTTKPGLTVWNARGEGAIEKGYFIADSPDDVLLEFDYSNADARVVAALSGDRRYAERFEPGADGHMINAIAAWGKDIVDTDPAGYRQKAKPLGHGWSYGGRPNALSRSSGAPLEDARSFCEGMDSTYHVLVRWQNKVRREGNKGYVVNWWGRKMPVEKERAFTQAPALLGQSGTREIICDAILRLPVHILRRLKAQIHDALVFSVPRAEWEKWRDEIIHYMQWTWEEAPGQPIDFPVSSGPPADNWYEAGH